MRRIDAGSQVIALTSFLDPEVSRRALQAGAACCLVKDASAGALLEAIRDAGRADQAGHMTFVQAKTGESTEAKTRALIRWQKPRDCIRWLHTRTSFRIEAPEITS